MSTGLRSTTRNTRLVVHNARIRVHAERPPHTAQSSQGASHFEHFGDGLEHLEVVQNAVQLAERALWCLVRPTPALQPRIGTFSCAQNVKLHNAHPEGERETRYFLYLFHGGGGCRPFMSRPGLVLGSGGGAK